MEKTKINKVKVALQEAMNHINYLRLFMEKSQKDFTTPTTDSTIYTIKEAIKIMKKEK